jgi:hypothetical protein
MQSAIQLQLDFSQPIVLKITQADKKYSPSQIDDKTIANLTLVQDFMSESSREIFRSILSWKSKYSLSEKQVDVIHSLHSRYVTHLAC